MMWGAGWSGMWFFWILFLGLIVWLAVTLVREPSSQAGRDARAILEERYARDEIDRDEFLARRELLERR